MKQLNVENDQCAQIAGSFVQNMAIYNIKTLLKVKKFCQSVFNILTIAIKIIRKLSDMYLQNFAKVAKIRQIWSHWKRDKVGDMQSKQIRKYVWRPWYAGAVVGRSDRALQIERSIVRMLAPRLGEKINPKLVEGLS